MIKEQEDIMSKIEGERMGIKEMRADQSAKEK